MSGKGISGRQESVQQQKYLTMKNKNWTNEKKLPC